MSEKRVFHNHELDRHLRKTTVPTSKTLLELTDMICKTITSRGLKIVPGRAVIRSVSDCNKALPQNHMSVQADIDKDTALAFQQKTGAEISYDHIIDRRKGKRFPLLTRGSPGMAGSDHGLFFMCSSLYLVKPIFHTHPEYRNELGRYKPSISDFKAIYLLKNIQEFNSIFDTVLFPDSSRVVYGFGCEGRPLIQYRLATRS